MVLVMGCLLFDRCEAGHTELGVGLDLEPLIGNVSTTVAALSVVFRAHELQRVLDVSKPLKGPHLPLHGDVVFEIGRGLVGRIRIEFCGRLGGEREVGAGEQYRTLPDKFPPKIGASNIRRWSRTAGRLSGSAWLSLSKRDSLGHWLVPLSRKSCTRSKARLDHDGLNSWLQLSGHQCVGDAKGRNGTDVTRFQKNLGSSVICMRI